MYARPGYRTVGVHAPDWSYRCVVGLEEVTATGEARYSAQPSVDGRHASVVRIPAYAGRYYRVEARVELDTLLLNVMDESAGRTVVEQRELITAGCLEP